ncbi:hypothetical protein [Stenotrophomonas sp. Marseille-Q4652]|uniref:hypothetical protein n=1 Tax=Stenotrophomonas sp. Marseille-Q4652 TaxID=2866595 RepID=UPI001CE3F22A|nr:hypothetical protein [Stenotrophomonas sp. Marseille-Q4652]
MSPRSLLSLVLLPLAAPVAAQVPEMQRPAASAQADGVVHTLRQIPEACARLEGVFTGEAGNPYRYSAVRTSEQCQARARFVDFDKARPSEAKGWKLNDVIRVPRATCPSQQAVVRVWRLPVQQAPKLDGQGQARIYLEEARQQAAAGAMPKVPLYAAKLTLEGKACR